MKQIITSILILMFSEFVSGQINWRNYSTSYNSNTIGQFPVLVTARPYNGVYQYEELGKNAVKHLEQTNYISEKIPVQSTKVTVLDAYDSSEVYFLAAGVNPDNSEKYDYNVFKNGQSEVRGWSSISSYTNPGIEIDGKNEKMGFIGGFFFGWGNYIIVSLRDRVADSIISITIVNWIQTRPKIINVYTENEFDALLERTKESYNLSQTEKDKMKWINQYKKEDLDSNFLPKVLDLASSIQTVIFWLQANVNDKMAVEYEVVKDGEIIRQWGANELNNNMIWIRDLKAGEYILKIRYRAQRHNITILRFKKREVWYLSSTMKILLGSLIAAFFYFLLLGYKYFIQKKQVQMLEFQKHKISNELKTIHTQLNPHFIFNALNSIQDLLNTEQVYKANKYLSSFSRLLRATLESSEYESIRLNDELQTLREYLLLEQLRFNFNFEFSIDEQIDVNDVEIIPFILQPIVENAIKHGVSTKREEGKVSVEVKKIGESLVININDNGMGFTKSENRGFGLKITRERLEHFNSTSIKQVLIDQISGRDGVTTFRFTLKNWFL